jgi:hypothetical protein
VQEGREGKKKKCPWKKQLKETVSGQGTENPAMAFFRREPLLFHQDIKQKISWLAWGESSCSLY